MRTNAKRSRWAALAVVLALAGCLTSEKARQESKTLEQVKLHIAAKADLNAFDETGKTALMCAAERHQFEVVKLLVGAGADVHLTSRGRISGFTAVHYAAWHGDDKIIELLLSAGAKVDVKGMWNATPLHQAASSGHGSTVLLLLARGADPTAVTENGCTAVHELARASASVNDLGPQNLKAIKALLAGGVKANAVDKGGTTPLHLAALTDHKPIVQLLLDQGADVNAKNKGGRTPLHYANFRRYYTKLPRNKAVVALLEARGGKAIGRPGA